MGVIHGAIERLRSFVARFVARSDDRPPQRVQPEAADRGGASARIVPPDGVDADPDFADEHSRPTYADEPAAEGPDESVPRDRGGAGGMDVR